MICKIRGKLRRPNKEMSGLNLSQSKGILPCLFFAIPVWLIMWQVKFRGLETPDPDYKTAKRDLLITLIIWLPALVFEVISIFFMNLIS